MCTANQLTGFYVIRTFILNRASHARISRGKFSELHLLENLIKVVYLTGSKHQQNPSNILNFKVVTRKQKKSEKVLHKNIEVLIKIYIHGPIIVKYLSSLK